MHVQGGKLTFLVSKLLAEFLDQLVHLGVHNHLILVPDAVLTQEVKLDVIARHALHILNLPADTSNHISWMQSHLKQHRRPTNHMFSLRLQLAHRFNNYVRYQ